MSGMPDKLAADAARADRFGSDYAKLLLEQYKLVVESSNKVSERRAGAHTLLLTANTLIVTVYSVAVGKDVALRSAGGLWQAALPLAGLAMTLAWFSLIRSYRALNSAKFVVIHAMEDQLPAQPFRLEWEALQGQQTLTYVALSRVEQIMPIVFACLYAALGLSVVRT